MKHKVIAESLVNMGNVCSSNNNNKSGGAKPPESLTKLVDELAASESKDSPWAEEFREFLRQRQQKDLENALDFVILQRQLSSVHDEAGKTESKTKQQDLKEKRTSLLNQMGKKYFQTESAQCLSLQNQAYFSLLSEKLPKVNEKSTESDLEEVIKLVNAAKEDHKIMKSGLDLSYNTFQANKPSLSVKTVLLSIL